MRTASRTVFREIPKVVAMELLLFRCVPGGIFPLRIISLSPSATCCAVLIRLTTKPSIPSTSASVVVLVLHNSLCYCRVQSI